jgi:hypothetical protein
MSNRSISGGTGGWGLRLKTLLPPCGDCLEIWEPQTPGTSGPLTGLYTDYFIFTLVEIDLKKKHTNVQVKFE